MTLGIGPGTSKSVARKSDYWTTEAYHINVKSATPLESVQLV
jgi:hypothetical protein